MKTIFVDLYKAKSIKKKIRLYFMSQCSNNLGVKNTAEKVEERNILV